MADTLVYLDGVASRVAAALLPSELKDVADFLLGRHWLRHSGLITDRSAAPAEQGGGPSASGKVPAAVRVPNGLLAWHGFIPLAIGATSLVSVLSADGRAAVSDFFVREGFSKMFAVNFVSNSSASGGTGGGAVGGGAGGSGSSLTTFDGRTAGPAKRLGTAAAVGTMSHVRLLQSARSQCVDAIRLFCTDVVDEAKEAQRLAAAEPPRKRHRPPGRGAAATNGPSHTDGNVIGAEDSSAAVKLPVEVIRRLLVIVRCCSDNRSAASTTGGGGRRRRVGVGNLRKGRGGGRGPAAATTAAAVARRHRHGADPLHLLLHDVAAVLSLTDARLAATGWQVRIAVLVQPEDQVYGGALLARRLSEQFGQRFGVRLFLQGQDDEDEGEEERDEGGATTAIEGKGKAVGGGKVSRTRRLLSAWEPAVLYKVSPTDGSRAAPGESERGQLSQPELEATLLRHERFFFLRHSNLPLCCFLHGALRLFPVIAPPAVLRHWQVLWAARHSLQDVLLGVHAVLSPFRSSSAFAEAVDVCWQQGQQRQEYQRTPGTAAVSDKGPSAATGLALVDAALVAEGRQRRGFADVLEDSTDLLDGLLCAAGALAGESGRGEAVMFLLLYRELVLRKGALRLGRIPAVAAALDTIYAREWRCAAARMGLLPTDDGDDAVGPTVPAEERVRRAIARHLPYLQPSRLVVPADEDVFAMATVGAAAATTAAVEPAAVSHRRLTALPPVMQLANLRTPAGPALQRSLLASLLPPATSLLELQAATVAFQTSVNAALATASGTTTNQQQQQQQPVVPLLSPNNFYSPLVPDSVRVLYLLTAHAVGARTERLKSAPVVQLQQACQLSDERLLLALRDLQLAGLAVVNLREQTARTTLSA